MLAADNSIVMYETDEKFFHTRRNIRVLILTVEKQNTEYQCEHIENSKEKIPILKITFRINFFKIIT